MSTRLFLPTRRIHITQKVKIAGQRTLYLSVHDDEYPIEILIRQNIDPLIKSPVESLPQDTQQKGKIRDGSDHHGSWCVTVFWHQLGTMPRPSQPKGGCGKGGVLTTLPKRAGLFSPPVDTLFYFSQMRQTSFGMCRGDIGVACFTMLNGFFQMLNPFVQMPVFV